MKSSHMHNGIFAHDYMQMYTMLQIVIMRKLKITLFFKGAMALTTEDNLALILSN